MKRLFNQLKKHLGIAKVSEAQTPSTEVLPVVAVPSVLQSLAEVNQTNEARIIHCQAICQEAIAKLENGETLTPYDYVLTQAAIYDLINHH